MKKIKIRDMISSKKWINDMKKVVGKDRTIEIYISPGGDQMNPYNPKTDENKKSRSKKPKNGTIAQFKKHSNKSMMRSV